MPPDGDCWPLDVDGVPDEFDGDELPLGDDGGTDGDGTETLGVAQPAASSATAATKLVRTKFHFKFNGFSARHGTRAAAPHRATHHLRSA